MKTAVPDWVEVFYGLDPPVNQRNRWRWRRLQRPSRNPHRHQPHPSPPTFPSAPTGRPEPRPSSRLTLVTPSTCALPPARSPPSTPTPCAGPCPIPRTAPQLRLHDADGNLSESPTHHLRPAPCLHSGLRADVPDLRPDKPWPLGWATSTRHQIIRSIRSRRVTNPRARSRNGRPRDRPAAPTRSSFPSASAASDIFDEAVLWVRPYGPGAPTASRARSKLSTSASKAPCTSFSSSWPSEENPSPAATNSAPPSAFSLTPGRPHRSHPRPRRRRQIPLPTPSPRHLLRRNPIEALLHLRRGPRPPSSTPDGWDFGQLAETIRDAPR